MRIAVIAWGSRIWSYEGLAVQTSFERAGPILALEFSRIADDGQLALVLDEAAGTPCPTWVALSACADPDRAVANLWRREGPSGETLPANIREQDRVGCVLVGQPYRPAAKASEGPLDSVRTIGRWARKSGFDAAIWPARGGNFRDKTGRSFSVHAALRHLGTLGGEACGRAVTAIRLTPAEVRTPLRKAVEARWRIV